MRLSDRKLALIVSLAAVLAFAGCIPTLLDPNSSGQLKVRVTDAPFPLDLIAEAWVTITRVDVLRSLDDDPNEPDDPNELEDPNDPEDPNDSAALEGLDASDSADSKDAGELKDAEDPNEPDDPNDDGDDGDGHSPWITVFDDPNGVPFDLMTLRNGRLADLVDAELPAGSYKQIRVYVEDGRVVPTDGREFPLSVPSGDSSGIKLRIRFEIAEGQETEVLLDFDLSRVFKPVPGGAFKHAGEIHGFKFRPSVGLRAADLDDCGSLGGEATNDQGDPEPDVEVGAYRGAELVATTYTEADGSYTFVGLTPDEYRLEFTGDEDFEPRELTARVERGKHTADANSRNGKQLFGD